MLMIDAICLMYILGDSFDSIPRFRFIFFFLIPVAIKRQISRANRVIGDLIRAEDHKFVIHGSARVLTPAGN